MIFRSSSVLWACPFRPFFLATGVYAIVALAGWLGVLLVQWPVAEPFAPMRWHSHEMLYGMVSAAITGFLLTAMCNWTGARPLAGRGLQALFGLWLLGRIVMWLGAWLPGWLVATVDLSFLLVVAVYAGRVIIQARSWRNLVLIAVLMALWLGNLAFHLDWGNGALSPSGRPDLIALLLVVVLMTIIGGRITPAFTRNWLQRNGKPTDSVRTYRHLKYVTLGSMLGLLLAVVLNLASEWIGILAALAGLCQLLRLWFWSGWKARSDALVWILHAAYAWIPIGLLLMAASSLTPQVPATAWIHALGTGAMGTLILAVMTRVSLGHTGRPLVLPDHAILIYWLILAASVLRLATALNWLTWQPGVLLTALIWAAAFAAFVLIYLPILTRPRADGRPG